MVNRVSVLRGWVVETPLNTYSEVTRRANFEYLP